MNKQEMNLDPNLKYSVGYTADGEQVFIPVLDNNEKNDGKIKSSGKTIAGFVLSICGLLLPAFWYISVPCGILAIRWGSKGMKNKEKLSTPSLVLGIIEIVLTVLIYAISLMFALFDL